MKSLNFLRKTTDRESFTFDILEKFKERINFARRILVKPNIVSYEDYPTTTHPKVLATVLDFLKGKDVAVADGMAIDILTTHQSLVRHPLSRVCEERGVPLFDLHQGRSATYQSSRKYSISISVLPKNFDFIISLAVLKSHGICKMTGALKNQFGYLTKAERIKMHAHLKDIHKGIAEVNALVPAQLFIVDAVETLVVTNEQRHGGKKAFLGYMLGGDDPVALDSAGLKLLQTVDEKLWGLTAEDVPYLKYAFEYGLGDINREVIEN